MKQSKVKKVCNKEDKITNMKNDEGKQNKEAMQQIQDPQYHTDEANHNKGAMQQRRQDPKYLIDEGKQNKGAMQQ